MKTRFVSIVGPISSGPSGTSWFGGKYCGAETVIKEMGGSGDIEVYINSPGGSVFAGFEIVNAFNAAILAGRAVTMYVSPLAASAASYIACGVKGATVCMADNAKLMFHAPWTVVVGSKGQLQDSHDLLAKMEMDIKAAVVSRGAKFDDSWFDTGRMKFFSAKEAIGLGLADKIAGPPSELIGYVSDSIARVEDDGIWGRQKEEPTGQRSHGLVDYDSYAANIEFHGYLQHLCDEHYDQKTLVKDVTEDTFKVVGQDGSAALLKYAPDSLTIVAIDWDALGSYKEDGMNKTKQAEQKSADKTVADQTVEPVATAPAVEPKMADKTLEPTAIEPVVEPAASKPGATEPGATEPTVEPKAAEPGATEPAVEPKASVSGLTEDMIAFAKENYQIARAEHIAKIKDGAENVFSDKELDEFPIKMLAKLAKLADKPAGDSAAVADNSIVPSPKGQTGAGGSLPPPKL